MSFPYVLSFYCLNQNLVLPKNICNLRHGSTSFFGKHIFYYLIFPNAQINCKLIKYFISWFCSSHQNYFWWALDMDIQHSWVFEEINCSRHQGIYLMTCEIFYNDKFNWFYDLFIISFFLDRFLMTNLKLSK